MTSPQGDEVEIWDESEDQAWRSMAEQLAALDRADEQGWRRGLSYR